MKYDLLPEVVEALSTAEKRPIMPEPGDTVLLDRDAILRLIPHRDPFLFIDRVWAVDQRAIAGAFDLTRGGAVLQGHFPAEPVWPGVLQLEGMAQLGLVLLQYTEPEPGLFLLTQIRAARFLRAVLPGPPLEIQVRLIGESPFYTAVGQCLQDGHVCSVAAIGFAAK